MFGRKRELVLKYLGEEAAEHGDFGLLGVTPERCTEVHVETALQMRLDQLRRHPEGESREADEIRLMLHEAAEHLRDPVIRGALLQHAAVATGVGRGNGREEVGGSPRGLSAYRSSKEDRRERLAVMAIGGVVVLLVVVFLSALVLVWPQAGPAGGGAGAGGAGAAAGEAVVEGAGGAGSVATSGDGEREGAGVGLGIGRDGLWAERKAVGHRDVERTAFMEPSLLLKRLRDASRLMETDEAGALSSFEAGLGALLDHWPGYDEGTLRAAVEAVVQFVHVLRPGSDGTATAIDAIGAGAGVLVSRKRETYEKATPLFANELTRAAGSAGLLSRLSRERDLGEGMKREVSRRIGALVSAGVGQGGAEGTFEGGALGALAAMPLLLVSPAEANVDSELVKSTTAGVQRWAESVAAVTRGQEQQAEGVMVDALEALLIRAREPQDDLRVYDAVQELVKRCKWRDGGPARARLMGWFRDSRVSMGDLRVVTSVLASGSSAGGVDATMALGLNASQQDRMRLRVRYGQAWGFVAVGEGEGSGLLDRWLVQADRILKDTPGQQSPGWWLWQAARLARLNLAARAIWLGDTDGALMALSEDDPVRPEEVTQTGGPGVSPRSPAPGGQATRSGGGGRGSTGVETWAARFLAAERNIPVRLERLSELESVPRPLSAADAQVLVETAVFGVPIQVQVAAQSHVGRDPNDTAVLASLLEVMPRAPKSRLVSEAIEKATLRRLPSVTDPRWDVAARRALVERLLALMAAESREAWQERLAEQIARIYLAAMNEEASANAPAADALRGAELLLNFWRVEAERTPFAQGWGVTLPQLDSRAEGRRQLASGPVQMFAAEQASAAEAMAFVFAADRSSRSADVQAVMDELAAVRRSSTHVFEQVLGTERAMTRLWMLRLAERMETVR